nr:beige protein like 1 [Quercus suber]
MRSRLNLVIEASLVAYLARNSDAIQSQQVFSLAAPAHGLSHGPASRPRRPAQHQGETASFSSSRTASFSVHIAPEYSPCHVIQPRQNICLTYRTLSSLAAPEAWITPMHSCMPRCPENTASATLMAPFVGRVGRQRSSTGASRGLSHEEQTTETAHLIHSLRLDSAGTSADFVALSSSVDTLIQHLESEPAAKDIFRHGAGFEAVLDLVRKMSSQEGNDYQTRLALLKGLLRLLSKALIGHRGNHRYFTSFLDGWEVLRSNCTLFADSLLTTENPVGSISVLVESLFAVAVDDADIETGWTDLGVPESFPPAFTVCNPESCLLALRIALSVSRQAAEAAQVPGERSLVMILNHVAAVAASSTRNQVTLWQTGLGSQILPVVLDQRGSSEVIDAASKAFVSLIDLGISSLDDVAFLFRSAHQSEAARDLLLRVLQRSKDSAFVQFDLTMHGYASIEFPSLPRAFPPSTGYSLTAWIRIDDFDSDSHTTLFGAFDATQACFVLLYLEKDSHHVILQTSVRSSRPSVRFKTVRFVTGRWYHIALVHRRATSDSRHSPASLFIDGEFKEQIKCTYPDIPPEVSGKSDGGQAAQPGVRHTRPVQAFFGTPHDLALETGRNRTKSRWSLGNAHLYQAPLSDEFVAVHHRLGPRYYGNMQDCLGPLLTYRASAELNRYNELLHPDKSDKSDIVVATEEYGSKVMPEHRLLLSIAPTNIVDLENARSGKITAKLELDRRALPRYKQLAQKARAVALNGALPSVNEAMSRSHGAGILTGDPVVAIPNALDNALWCLAGSVPVLIQLLESASTRSAFLQSVRIAFECIRDNWRISEAMEKGNGFGMLAVVIREKLGFESGPLGQVTGRKAAPALSNDDRQGLSFELLQLILEFVGYDQNRPESSMIVNPMAYRVLLVDFDTWRRSDFQTQQLYYTQFAHFVLQNIHHVFNHKRLTRMRVTRKLVEALKSEDISAEVVPHIMKTMKALIDANAASTMFKDLAMFAAYGLQEERALTVRPVHSLASIVNLRQRTASWARSARSSRPGTPNGALPQSSKNSLSRAELALHVLRLISDIACEDKTGLALRRFNRAVPNRWLLHLLAETDVRVVDLALGMMCRSLFLLRSEFKTPFVDKNGGFTTLKSRMKIFWRSPVAWVCCFAMLFGRDKPATDNVDVNVFSFVEALNVNNQLAILHPEMLPTIMIMLETGLRSITKTDAPVESEAKLLTTMIQFLSELYSRSEAFRVFASSSRYVQELLFVLYPVLVGSDRLSAETELQSDKDSLSFKGEEVRMRPHSNSIGERPPSVRSLNMEDENKSSPSPLPRNTVQRPRRLSSFVLVKPSSVPATFTTTLAPKVKEPVKINVGNTAVESLLEVCINLFIDQVCHKKDFAGIGLFLKVPPGFREHQAYFESYVLVNTLSQLWNFLQLNQSLFLQSLVLANLSRYCQHMAEAVFEGWFIDGAQPVLDFTGKVLEYLQQPGVGTDRNVRLCSHNISAIRIVFLRVTLWRLSELDETENESSAVEFLHKMNYWQTILFSSENQETPFIRLICFLLYMKLVSDVPSVRLAAASLWRTVLVHKPTESATLLSFAMGSEQRHLSTGFMKLVSLDDADFIAWIDENRGKLDAVFSDALSKPWDDFVNEENKRNEETAKARLAKRKEKLRQWHAEESQIDDFLHRYEVSTNHWRSNVHAQERLRLQRALQDHQESVNHLFSVFSKMEKQSREPCGMQPVPVADQKWQLDETEAVNRMRMRTVPDSSEQKGAAYQPKRKPSTRVPNPKLAVNTQIPRIVHDNIISSFPVDSPAADTVDGTREMNLPDRPRAGSGSVSGSQLLEGGFEMVDDPHEDEDGLVEDKNRKIMTSLMRGDMVQQLYNTSRIRGLEAVEGLLVVGKNCLYLQDNFFQRSDGEIVSVSHAPEDERDPYVQLISGKDVGTSRVKPSAGDQETRHWTWREVLSISKRRFLFRDVSVEVFFTDGRSYLLTCMSPKIRDELYSAILVRAPHVHSNSSVAGGEDAWRLDTLRNPEEGPQSLGSKFASVFNSTPSHAATKKWIRGEMSNFQYLMLVNTMAGRTFNDLTQYPVFPWVLADYTSEELDLTNPKTFRDFSKPMGCQTATREAEYRDRYKQFAEMGDQSAPPFHYGTHYSSAMIVSSYLIRLQPFVQSYLLLQGGSFDHADRLFDSIEKTWLSASRDTMSDVRELTPEFFYLPEFLVNVNKYDFGVKQGDGKTVNDIHLPRWANGDPHIFIAKHREALESPYVSEHLHQWIDLVFGFKQRGDAAVEATNVFQHLSYGGAKNLDTIHDPVERLATIGIIHSFGQTPLQVFQRPHAARELSHSATSRLDSMASSLTRLPDSLYSSDEKVAGLTFSASQERLLCNGPTQLNLLPNCDRHMAWGFSDHSIRFFSSATKRLLGLYENTHIGPVTAVTFADSKTLVTAGVDCTLAVWSVAATRDSVDLQPKTYLFGHRTAATILAASRVFSALLSASTDGQVLLWGLNRFNCIRILRPAGSPPIQAARVSNVTGHIAICCGADLLIYTLNGVLLVQQTIADHPSAEISTCAFYEGVANEWPERELIFTGHPAGVANVWALTTLADGAWYLQLVKRMNHVDGAREDGGNRVAAITAILPMPQAVFTGDEEGKVWEWDCVQRHASFSAKGR